MMTIALLAATAAAVASADTPSAVVDRQIEAYNRGDAEAFARTYAPDARIYEPGRGDAPKLIGREAIRSHYATLFVTKPGRRAMVVSRLSADNYVVDHERLTESDLTAVVAYEVRDGAIARVWLHVIERGR